MENVYFFTIFLEKCILISRTFFQAYHQEHLGELKMHLENEGWELCPVKSTFKVLQLKEFRALSRCTKPSSFSMQTKSPRKSVKKYTGKRSIALKKYDQLAFA